MDKNYLIKEATNPKQYDMGMKWDQYGISKSPTRQLFFDYLDENIDTLSGKDIIDIGCGSGYLYSLYKKKDASTIYGIEPSVKNVEMCNKFYPEFKVDCYSVDEYEAKVKYNVAFLIMVFEHLQSLDQAFNRIYSFLLKDGWFYAIVGDKDYLTEDRFDYSLEKEELDRGEVAVATKRSIGTMYDIIRPLDNFIEAGEKAGFILVKQVPIIPTKKIIEMEPKYKVYKNRPLSHLLIFKK
jgi:trans-aconitate methyltransferase